MTVSTRIEPTTEEIRRRARDRTNARTYTEDIDFLLAEYDRLKAEYADLRADLELGEDH